MIKYAVEITLKNGKKKYLSHTSKHLRPTLIKSKSTATLLDSRRIADIVSDHFWQNYWDKEDYDSREITVVQLRGKNGEL